MKKIFPLILLLICSNAHAVLDVELAFWGSDDHPGWDYKVEEIISGDTIAVRTSANAVEKVRLIGMDAPDKETAEGRASQEFLKGLLKKGDVIDLQMGTQQRDPSREFVLAHVLLPDPRAMYSEELHRQRNNSIYLHINAVMIHAGYATPRRTPPNVRYAVLFQKLFEEAKAERRGLWKEDEELVDCTMDVKQCPDGSYVGRTPPKCEFKACPEEGREEKRGLWKKDGSEEIIHVSAEDQSCEKNEDCTTVVIDCAKPSCDCGTPVNKIHAQKYADQLKACSQKDVFKIGTTDVTLTNCELTCVSEVKCSEYKCIAEGPWTELK